MADHDTGSASRRRMFNEHTSGDEESLPTDYHYDIKQRDSASGISEKQPVTPRHPLYIATDPERWYRFWRRFTRHGKKKIGVMQSLRAFALSSCMLLSFYSTSGEFNHYFVGLNIFLIFTPLAWISHWAERNHWLHGKWPPQATFVRTSKCIQ